MQSCLFTKNSPILFLKNEVQMRAGERLLLGDANLFNRTFTHPTKRSVSLNRFFSLQLFALTRIYMQSTIQQGFSLFLS